MAQASEALRNALSAAKRLPTSLQRELAERLLAPSLAERNSVTVRIQRLPRSKLTRLTALMDKSNEGILTKAEQAELEKLGRETDQIVLSNSLALARAARPELFDEKGMVIRRRLGKISESSSGTRRSSLRNRHR
jgi:hypothetical protein